METPLRTRRWTRVEYERMVDKGIFRSDEHLELLDGVLVVREPQGSLHAAAVAAAQLVLQGAFGPGYTTRGRSPVALDEASEPEPDVTVVRGGAWDYRRGHPATPVLVVEVADSSLAFDRRKGGLYARAGVQDYWIVNLMDGVLEIYRQPTRSADEPYGARYLGVRLLSRGATVTPLGALRARIPVADLLPPE